jgi:hypothetical protein
MNRGRAAFGPPVLFSGLRIFRQEKVMGAFARGVAGFVLCVVALGVPVTAGAAEESADAEITIRPKFAKTFFKDAFRAADGTVETVVSLPGQFPEYQMITPMKVSDLRFPPSGVLTFRPKPSMPVCPDDKLGPPPTTNSIPVPNMLARCPGALVGNGTAVFALAKSNNPAAARDGEILIFNGGRVGGLPKIKIYAYSYDIQVGVYTSAILQPDGQLRIEIPYLPFDSALTAIGLSIPGKRVVLPKPDLGVRVTLPAGADPDYLQVRCPDDDAGLPWTTDLTLGSRDAIGNPEGPPEFVIGDSGTVPCTGVSAIPRLAGLGISGPGRAIRNQPTVFKVRIRNVGGRAVAGGRLFMSGRGVRAGATVGRIGGGRTRTVTVRARFRLRGPVRASFRVRTSNAGSKVAIRTVRVR